MLTVNVRMYGGAAPNPAINSTSEGKSRDYFLLSPSLFAYF